MNDLPEENPSQLDNNKKLIGRETELKKLLKHISPDYRQHITVVNGIGGIGKTSLVLEAASLCQNSREKPKYLSNLKIPKFDAIIFVSIKKSYFDFNNEIKQVYKESALQYIFKIISSTLKDTKNKINKSSGAEQIKTVYQWLNKQQTLLIIDNLEIMGGVEKDKILLFLSNLPTKVKAIITTREREIFYSPISLEFLSQEDGLNLIKQQAQKKEVILTKEESLKIYHLSGGIPLAIVYAVSQKKVDQKINYFLIKDLFNLSNSFSDNKTYSLFKKSQELLKNESEHHLLISISFFPDCSSIEAISKIADFEINSVEINEGMEKLEKLSLIKKQDNKYLMHPVTREYVAKEISQYYDFEKDARSRWVQWYIYFARKYGGRDWENWRNKYDRIKAEWNNLLAVLEWCAGKGYYESIRDLWKNLNQFANLEGYWQDRIFWLSWLIEESKKRGDWKTASYSMSEKGLSLIQIGDISQAEYLLQEAFDLEKAFDLSTEKNVENQTLICQHFALLYIYQEKYQDALNWLKKEEFFAKSINLKKEIIQKEILRRMIAIDTLKAEILFKQENYEEAYKIYDKIVKISAQIGWHRRKNEAQGRKSIIEEIQNFNKQKKSDQYIKNYNHFDRKKKL